MALADDFQARGRLAAARLDPARARPAPRRRGSLRRGRHAADADQRDAVLRARLALAPARGQHVRPRRRGADRARHARAARRRRASRASWWCARRARGGSRSCRCGAGRSRCARSSAAAGRSSAAWPASRCSARTCCSARRWRAPWRSRHASSRFDDRGAVRPRRRRCRPAGGRPDRRRSTAARCVDARARRAATVPDARLLLARGAGRAPARPRRPASPAWCRARAWRARRRRWSRALLPPELSAGGNARVHVGRALEDPEARVEARPSPRAPRGRAAAAGAAPAPRRRAGRAPAARRRRSASHDVGHGGVAVGQRGARARGERGHQVVARARGRSRSVSRSVASTSSG